MRMARFERASTTDFVEMRKKILRGKNEMCDKLLGKQRNVFVVKQQHETRTSYIVYENKIKHPNTHR